MAASQAQAFIDQYLQRLSGNLDEARLNLDRIINGVRYQVMNETARTEIEAEAQLRVNTLNTAYTAIMESGVITQPFTFFRYVDESIMTATVSAYVPAVPIGANSIIYTIFGIALVLTTYEIIKVIIKYFVRQPRRRKFRKRGL